MHCKFGRRVEAGQALHGGVLGCCGGIPMAVDGGGFGDDMNRNDDGPVQTQAWSLRMRNTVQLASMVVVE